MSAVLNKVQVNGLSPDGLEIVLTFCADTWDDVIALLRRDIEVVKG